LDFNINASLKLFKILMLAPYWIKQSGTKRERGGKHNATYNQNLSYDILLHGEAGKVRFGWIW
jgi:hypothetical protein